MDQICPGNYFVNFVSLELHQTCPLMYCLWLFLGCHSRDDCMWQRSMTQKSKIFTPLLFSENSADWCSFWNYSWFFHLQYHPISLSQTKICLYSNCSEKYLMTHRQGEEQGRAKHAFMVDNDYLETVIWGSVNPLNDTSPSSHLSTMSCTADPWTMWV